VTTAIFWVLAPLAAASGFMVFRFNSMARVTIALLVSFLAVGGLLILLGLGYLGVVVILMMVMEMIIMAVFMIAYMMNPAGLMQMAMYHNKRWSLAVAVTVFLLLGAGIFAVPWPHQRPGAGPASPAFQLGLSLMGPQMLTMITLGFVLFATMVAAVLLATHRGRYDRFGDDLRRRPPADPVRGGVGR
jgi:NADH-quinone oxidoreductase subunit J